MPPSDSETSRQQRIEFLQQDKRQAQQVFRELQSKADPALISPHASTETKESRDLLYASMLAETREAHEFFRNATLD